MVKIEKESITAVERRSSLAIVQTKDRLITRIKELQTEYEHVMSEGNEEEFSEPDVGSKFILRLLEALGWNINNIDEVKEQKRTLSGPVDYSLSISKRPKLLLELKKFSETLDGKRVVRGKEETFPDQAIRYAWNLRVDWVVLTNYKETRLYYSHVRRPKDGLVFSVKYDQYANAVDRLLILSKESVESGGLDTYEKRRERLNVNEEVLDDLLECRRLLTDNIRKNHIDISAEQVRESVQKTIDRLIVVRVAEDRRIVGSDSIWNEYDSWMKRGLSTAFMRSLKSIFRDFDEVYNTKLFEPHMCEDLRIDNQVLKTVIDKLYQYNFDLISADVLGAIYEDYIGHVLEGKGRSVEVVETMRTRRSEGIYYTPHSIVEYIVSTTIRPVLQRAKTPEEVSRIKVADPATGSGSFLIKAFDVVKEWYDDYHSTALDQYRSSGLFRNSEGAILVQNADRKILNENLFGVDKDPQAAEIASVNLMLKALKRDERLPTILGQSIKVADSLTLGWEAEFPAVYTQGGFDVVIGNPPWGADLSAIRDEVEKNYDLAKGQYDSYELFIELSERLLKNDGVWGFVIPDSIFKPEHKRLREFLVKNYRLERIVKLGEGFFENVFRASVVIVFSKARPTDNHIVRCLTLMKEDRVKLRSKGEVDLLLLEEEKGIGIPQKRFLEDPEYSFEIGTGELDADIMGQMEAISIDWHSLFDTWRGVEFSELGEVVQCPNCFKWDNPPRRRKGEYRDKVCKHCGHTYKYDKALAKGNIVSEKKVGKNPQPFISGVGVNRYYVSESKFLDTDKDGINYKDSEVYKGPKLLVRKTGIGVYATLDYGNSYVPQAVFIFKLQKTTDANNRLYRLEYILGVLNSRLMLYYYYKKIGDLEWKSFPYVTQKTIQQLPVAKIDFSNRNQRELHETIADKVSEILAKKGPVDRDEDLAVEDLVLKLYSIKPEEKMHIWEELEKVQKLRIIRETMGNAQDSSDS